MAWTLRPPHVDGFPVSEIVVTDESGNYESAWLDGVDYEVIRVSAYASNGASSVAIEQGFHDEGAQQSETNGGPSRIVHEEVISFDGGPSMNSYAGPTDLTLSARYFRFKVTGASPGDWVNVVIRRMA